LSRNLDAHYVAVVVRVHLTGLDPTLNPTLGLITTLYLLFFSAVLSLMSTFEHLDAIRKEPKGKHTATVILLHGLGDSGRGWQNLADDFGRDPRLQNVKWVFPHAPNRPLTIKQGMPVPSWFDILSFDITSKQDEPGMLQSVSAIHALIASELENGNLESSERVVLGGFSQGGTISLLAGLNSERKLGGIFVMSGRLALPKPTMQSHLSSHVNTTPVFWGHGTADPVVPYTHSQDGVEFLTSSAVGLKRDEDNGVTYHSYEGGLHTLEPKESEDLKE
jgi:lysophospholipase-1